MITCTHLPKGPGIYQIINTSNGKSYIGYAINVRKRVHLHKHYLRHNKHGNQYLQAAWNQSGESLFEFILLQECVIKHLCSYEDYWVKKLKVLDRAFGYNVKSTNFNDSPISLKRQRRKKIHPLKGIRPSSLCLQKAKEYWNNNPMTEEHKEACRKGLAKVDWVKLRENKRKRVINFITGEVHDSLIDVARLTGIPKYELSRRLLDKRKNNTNFKYI